MPFEMLLPGSAILRLSEDGSNLHLPLAACLNFPGFNAPGQTAAEGSAGLLLLIAIYNCNFTHYRIVSSTR